MFWLLIALLGAALGLIGTLVGAGGGFLAVPVLLLFFHGNPATVAGTSLVMVTANAIAGAASYARQGRVDLQTAVLLILASLPGTVLGSLVGPHLPARQFQLAFGTLLVGLAFWTAWKALHPPAEESAGFGGAGLLLVRRHLVLADGTAYAYAYPAPLAAGFALVIGFLGAVLGIGGGPLLVPALLFGLHMPVAVATATSQVMIAVSSAGAAAIYLSGGYVDMGQATALAAGALVGAPVGAWLSRRVGATWIVLTLAALLAILGLRLML